MGRLLRLSGLTKILQELLMIQLEPSLRLVHEQIVWQWVAGLLVSLPRSSTCSALSCCLVPMKHLPTLVVPTTIRPSDPTSLLSPPELPDHPSCLCNFDVVWISRIVALLAGSDQLLPLTTREWTRTQWQDLPKRARGQSRRSSSGPQSTSTMSGLSRLWRWLVTQPGRQE